MKYSAFLFGLLCAAASVSMAAASYGQQLLDTPVSLQLHNVTLGQALDNIARQTQVQFVFVGTEERGKEVKTSLEVTQQPLGSVLPRLLTPYGLSYQLINNRIVIRRNDTPAVRGNTEAPSVRTLDRIPLIPGPASPETWPRPLGDLNIFLPEALRISGKVSDEKGDPLPGVNILLKGTQRGSTTGVDGRFEIEVPGPDAVLTFSFVGYLSQDVAVGNRRELVISMVEDQKALEEVMVVGYGVQKKVSVTSAISEIKREELTKRPVSNMAQALQGQMPGLTILDQGGGPGKSNVTVRVRGVTTLSGNNNPLIIVDGVEQPLGDINPEDIESVSVLKDASSTAIYGSRAANGVLLITTKRAQSGKASVSYNGFFAVQQSNNLPEHMEVGDYMRLQNIARINVGSQPVYTEEYINEYVNATDRYKYPLPYTMVDAVLRKAPQINQTLSVSGGSENLKSRLSVRLQNQGGVIPNSKAVLGDIRLNNDFTLSSKLNFNVDLNYRNVRSTAPSEEDKIFERLFHGSLWTVPKYPDGTYGVSAQGQNALIYAELAGINNTVREFLVGNLQGNWDIVKGLRFTSQLAVRTNAVSGKAFFNKYTVNDYYNPDVVKLSQPVNRLVETRESYKELTINNLLNYTLSEGHHHTNILAGYSQIGHSASNIMASRQDFYNNDVQTLSQGANNQTKDNSGGEYKWGLRSFFSRVNYSYKDKYLFEANGRFDGSSRFVGKNKYSFFPSLSGGWRLSEETFWNDGFRRTIGELKLRGSWGKTGNQAVALYSYYPALTLVNYTFNGQPAPGYIQNTLVNDDLRWESTRQANVGLDAQLLNGRFSVSIDYYDKYTDGILLTLPVPGTLGLNPTVQNAGAVSNKGWEFLAGTKNKFGDFRLNIDLNMSINKNKVVSLAGTGPYISGNNANQVITITAEGLPIDAFWGYKSGGLFQTEEEVAGSPTIGVGIAPGDVKFLDLNNDQKIDANDMTYIGPSFPKYTFGGNFGLSYKGFEMTMLWQGAAEVKTNLFGGFGDYGNLEGFTPKIYGEDYWTPENTGARFPRPTKSDLRNTYQNDKELLNASYLRLKNVHVSYRVPASFSKKLLIEKLNVFISGTNLLTFSELTKWGMDPEVPAGRLIYYPQTSIYTIGVSAQF